MPAFRKLSQDIPKGTMTEVDLVENRVGFWEGANNVKQVMFIVKQVKPKMLKIIGHVWRQQ
jgi:hypothetical protein